MAIENINSAQPVVNSVVEEIKKEDETKNTPKQKGSSKDLLAVLASLAAIGAAGVAVYKHRDAKKAIEKIEQEAKKKIEEAEEAARKAADEVNKLKKELESKTSSNPEVKPEVKIEQKVEQKVEQKAEQQVEQKAEQQVEQKVEQQVEQKAEQQVEQKAEQQVEQKAEEQIERKAEQQVEQKAEQQVETKPETKGEVKTDISAPKSEASETEEKQSWFSGLFTRKNKKARIHQDDSEPKTPIPPKTQPKSQTNEGNVPKVLEGGILDTELTEIDKTFLESEIAKANETSATPKFAEKIVNKINNFKFKNLFKKKVKPAPEQKPEIKPEVKQEIEQKVEQKAEQQVEQKAEQQVEQKAEQQVEQKAEEQVEQKAEQQVEQKAEEQVEQKAEQQVEQKAEQQVEQKAEQQAEQQIEQQVEQLPEVKPSEVFKGINLPDVKTISEQNLIAEYNALIDIVKELPAGDPTAQRFLAIQGELFNHRGYRLHNGKLVKYVKQEVKPEVKLEQKVEQQVEQKAEQKVEQKAEIKPEVKPETKPVQKSAIGLIDRTQAEFQGLTEEEALQLEYASCKYCTENLLLFNKKPYKARMEEIEADLNKLGKKVNPDLFDEGTMKARLEIASKRKEVEDRISNLVDAKLDFQNSAKLLADNKINISKISDEEMILQGKYCQYSDWAKKDPDCWSDILNNVLQKLQEKGYEPFTVSGNEYLDKIVANHLKKRSNIDTKESLLNSARAELKELETEFQKKNNEIAISAEKIESKAEEVKTALKTEKKPKAKYIEPKTEVRTIEPKSEQQPEIELPEVFKGINLPDVKTISEQNLIAEYNALKDVVKELPAGDPTAQRFLAIQGELLNHRGYKIQNGEFIKVELKPYKKISLADDSKEYIRNKREAIWKANSHSAVAKKEAELNGRISVNISNKPTNYQHQQLQKEYDALGIAPQKPRQKTFDDFVSAQEAEWKANAHDIVAKKEAELNGRISVDISNKPTNYQHQQLQKEYDALGIAPQKPRQKTFDDFVSAQETEWKANAHDFVAKKEAELNGHITVNVPEGSDYFERMKMQKEYEKLFPKPEPAPVPTPTPVVQNVAKATEQKIETVAEPAITKAADISDTTKMSNENLVAEYKSLANKVEGLSVEDPAVKRFLEIQNELLNNRGYSLKNGELTDTFTDRAKTYVYNYIHKNGYKAGDKVTEYPKLYPPKKAKAAKKEMARLRKEHRERRMLDFARHVGCSDELTACSNKYTIPKNTKYSYKKYESMANERKTDADWKPEMTRAEFMENQEKYRWEEYERTHTISMHDTGNKKESLFEKLKRSFGF